MPALDMVSFNPHRSPCYDPYSIGKETDLERLSILPKVTQLESDEANTQAGTT